VSERHPTEQHMTRGRDTEKGKKAKSAKQTVKKTQNTDKGYGVRQKTCVSRTHRMKRQTETDRDRRNNERITKERERERREDKEPRERTSRHDDSERIRDIQLGMAHNHRHQKAGRFPVRIYR